MKNLFRTSIHLVMLVLLGGGLSSCGYNSMVNREEAVSSQWSQVENVYQRRLDLIQNLVNTVKGAAEFEKTTLENVVAARSRAFEVTQNIDPTKLTPDNIANFQKAQDQLGSAVRGMINVVVERYPELKANANFLMLQEQIEGTENRIAVERKKFNETVQDYNSYVRRFPNNITAKIFGFETKGYFHAAEGADKAPEVKFDFNDKK